MLLCLGAAALTGAQAAHAAPTAPVLGLPSELQALLAVQQAQLTGDDDFFGGSVAISGDTAVVSAKGLTTSYYQGSAYVFTRTGTTWSQQQKLTVADGTASDGFGSSVAISGDTVVVGDTGDTFGGYRYQSSAYVFTRTGSTWIQQQKLTVADGAYGDGFGSSVAISGDTVVVGKEWDTVGANYQQGSAYVFTRAGSTWSQQQKLAAADCAANDRFGNSVAIAGDTVVVGDYADTVGADRYQGSAYVFTRAGSTWSQQKKLTAADGAANDHFGNSVAIAGDTVVVGADWDSIVGADRYQGSAYVFTRAGSTWSQQQKLAAAADAAYDDRFGNSVAISGDTVVVGAFCAGGSEGIDQGSAYVFTRTGTAWSRLQKLTVSDGSAVGNSVAISGYTVVVGDESQRSAYIFAVTPPPKPSIAKLTPTAAHRRTAVVITGTGFGTRRGISYVKFGARKCGTYLAWSNTRIKVRVPAKASFGSLTVKVTTAGGTSNGKGFRVRR